VVNNPLSNVSVPILSAMDNDVGFVRTGSAWSYLGSSDQLHRVAARVLMNGEISPFPWPSGSNCTYNVVTFIGPAYNCIHLDPSTTLPNLTLSSGLVSFYSVELLGNMTTQGCVRARSKHHPLYFESIHNATYKTQIEFKNNIGVLTTDVERHEQQLDKVAIHGRPSDLSTSSLHSLSQTQPNSSEYTQQCKYSNMVFMHRVIVEILEGSIERASASSFSIIR
jgi:hypothetical protein